MKKLLKINLLLIICATVFVGCITNEDNDSVAKPIILPIIAAKYMQDAYIYGLGQANLVADLPDIVAIALDTVYGMEGGHGGKTGFDTVEIKKSELVDLPDLNKIGGSSISFSKFSKGGYKVSTTSNIVVAGPIADPGPTALEGNYNRINPATGAPTGYVLEVKKVFDGVYVIGNPGGAASVAFNPYLLYNHKNASGGDELRFPIQTDLCHGGLRLVSPTAPTDLTAGEYNAYPPIITSTSPFTLSWKVFEFSSADDSALHPGAALCNWGLGVRVFQKI